MDGTPCDNTESSNAICVQGMCTVRLIVYTVWIDTYFEYNLQPVGCDNVLESGAQTDTCGVCNGDGSSATKTTDTLTGSGGFGYHTVAVVPAGARDVRIAEAVSTSSVYLGKILNSYTAIC